MAPVKYAPSDVDDEAKKLFSSAQIASGVKFLTEFMVHQSIDSPLNGGGQTTQKWLRENGRLISPKFLKEFTSDLEAEDGGPLLQEKWQEQSRSTGTRTSTSTTRKLPESEIFRFNR